jgi:hypothetical protein
MAGLGATQPVVSRLAKVCYLGQAVPLWCARCLLVGPLESHHDPRRFGPKWTRLAEIEAT